MSEVEPIDQSVVEDAIYDWLVSVAEVVPSAVWANRNVPQPEYPYASLLLTGSAKEGGKDELRTTFDDSAPAGEEITIVSTGPRALALSVTFHVDMPRDNPRQPNDLAMALAEKARSSLGQLAVIEHFSAANMAIIRELGLQDISMAINGEWVSRAVLDVSLRVTAAMTEKRGYIEKVELVSTTGPGFDEVIDGSA